MSLLGSRTKRVLTYGRRGHRIVIAPDEKPSSEPSLNPSISFSKCENVLPESYTQSKSQQKFRSPSSKNGHSIKSAISSKSPGNKSNKSVPTRRPLGTYEPNTPGSPVQPPHMKKRVKVLGSKLPPTGFGKTSSSLIDVDIIVVDDGGRKLSQERRISRTGVQVNCLTASPLSAEQHPEQATRRKSRKSVVSDKKSLRKGPSFQSSMIINTDSDDEPLLPRPKGMRPRKQTIVISSEESDADIQAIPDAFSVSPKVLPSPSQPATPSQHFPVDVYERPERIPSPSPQIQTEDETFYRPKPRQLTPIRRSGRAYSRAHSPSSPSVDSDLDTILNFADISISSIEDTLPSQPEYLLPLLTECRQTTPHEFSAFIETFPFDPIVHSCGQEPLSTVEFRKIGEASYSEVFGIGNVVLKIIPLRNEDHMGHILLDLNIDSPPPSDAKDVLKEINVTRTIGGICNGFTKLLRAYVVRGKYPSLLLSCWDEFNEKKGSESIKPDTFSVSQTYAIIVLPNGGPDLEAYTFPPASKKCWSRASSIFWQVVRTLATAENLVSFEHRDLHWGQILVQNILPNTQSRNKAIKNISMDDAMHGVTATVIDLGLSRMDASKTMIHWTPFEQEVFEGKGDYQFDIYRLMKEHNGNSWVEYRPLTNVMWLHYLLQKLLTAKKLRRPANPRKAPALSGKRTSNFTERECYLCLVEMEALLGLFLQKSVPTKRKPARKAHQKTSNVVNVVDVDDRVERFAGAYDVLKYGIAMEWVSASL